MIDQPAPPTAPVPDADVEAIRVRHERDALISQFPVGGPLVTLACVVCDHFIGWPETEAGDPICTDCASAQAHADRAHLLARLAAAEGEREKAVEALRDIAERVMPYDQMVSRAMDALATLDAAGGTGA